ncbi:hypothetical protein HZU40_25065 [Mycolicibacterium fluoranthenivorans]|uniref:Uncharacterized protein n=1 Tax=Mycolicibacterium fluoranthenivorans TaxID=258505 RepID=A0A7G8PAS7_9MYCO|nr:hypothetical protein [Mycolicibacterium fluoranthenivorans]QNJ91443.1 hypothetical protein HZU40_25065 [Mycolicibacterium fluoranthenivorans]
MSHPPEKLVRRLVMVAEELQEVFAERGHHIDQALEVDEAFGSPQTIAFLMRDLAIDAVAAAASRVGVEFGPVNGSGRELLSFDEGIERRFRLRRASRGADGGAILMTANSDAPLRVTADEGDGLFPIEAWTFGWIPASGSALVAEAFVAPLLRFEPGTPGHLILGSVIPLLGPETPSGAFRPTDEGLEGFDDDELGGEADSV